MTTTITTDYPLDYTYEQAAEMAKHIPTAILLDYSQKMIAVWAYAQSTVTFYSQVDHIISDQGHWRDVFQDELARRIGWDDVTESLTSVRGNVWLYGIGIPDADLQGWNEGTHLDAFPERVHRPIDHIYKTPSTIDIIIDIESISMLRDYVESIGLEDTDD